jgi:hypothetical protein
MKGDYGLAIGGGISLLEACGTLSVSGFELHGENPLSDLLTMVVLNHRYLI